MAETRDIPLLRWGEALRAAQLSKRRSRRQVIVTAAVAALVCANLGAMIWAPRPRLVWNATPSTPIGLYRIDWPERIRIGDVVVAWAPDEARALGAQRHYVPGNVPLIKPVAAVEGDEVCAIGETVHIAGRATIVRQRRDGLGRSMPWWEGCVRLAHGQVLLLSMDVPTAFDGRYFGVTSSDQIVGRAHPLWVR